MKVLEGSAPDVSAAPVRRDFLSRLSDVLGATAAERLLASARLYQLPAGTVVIDEAESPDNVGFVLDGALGMVKTLRDGRAHLIGILVAGDHYGRIFDGPSSYRLETLSRARLVGVSRAVFESILQEDPKAEQRMLTHLIDELDTAREWVLLIGGKRVIERVASYLLVLLRRATTMTAGVPPAIHQPLSRRWLAQYLGTRPETISRALHQLEVKGAIRIESADWFFVTDTSKLAAIAGQDLAIDATSGHSKAN